MIKTVDEEEYANRGSKIALEVLWQSYYYLSGPTNSGPESNA